MPNFITNAPIYPLHASANETANGNSAALGNFSMVQTMRLQLAVTAGSGTTPTLDVVIEDTIDGTNWNLVGTFTQMNATGTQMLNIITPTCATLRCRWTIGGTAGPNFTFSVLVEPTS